MKGFNAPFNHRPNPLGTSRRQIYLKSEVNDTDGIFQENRLCTTFRRHELLRWAWL